MHGCSVHLDANAVVETVSHSFPFPFNAEPRSFHSCIVEGDASIHVYGLKMPGKSAWGRGICGRVSQLVLEVVFGTARLDKGSVMNVVETDRPISRCQSVE